MRTSVYCGPCHVVNLVTLSLTCRIDRWWLQQKRGVMAATEEGENTFISSCLCKRGWVVVGILPPLPLRIDCFQVVWRARPFVKRGRVWWHLVHGPVLTDWTTVRLISTHTNILTSFPQQKPSQLASVLLSSSIQAMSQLPCLAHISCQTKCELCH